MYSKRTNAKGNEMFYKDGKLVSKKTIPEDEMIQDLDMDNPDQTIDPMTPDDTVEPQSKVCVACGETATSTRFINMRTVNLCEDHYLTMTTGEIVAAMRDKN